MLTVEERHQLLQQFETVVTAIRALDIRRAQPGEQPVDTATRCAISTETAKHDFYEIVNIITEWAPHPAAAEARR